ncbi:MAG TPA: hypothetical protein VJ895_02940, partial [Candidatus Nanoarchaeia archaeon]|nr:hypothetical protein [Candidatus Nanoarchaeia archaeon]
MNKIFNLVFIGIFLVSVVSAGVSIEEGPKEIYNFGDYVEFTLHVSPNGYFENLLVLKMACGVNQVEIYREFIITETEIEKEIKVPLVKSFIGESKGSCVIKSVISGQEETISNKFKISDFIKIEPDYFERSVFPGENLQIYGNAIKENGESVEGVIEVNSSFGDSNIFKSGVVENGEFNLTISVPEKYRAGEQSLGFYVYEKDKKGN